MTTQVIDLDDLDLFTEGDPHAAWAWLRRHRPVYWNPTAVGGFWALTRYADVHAAYVDTAAFSSRQGTIIGGSFRSASDSASGQMLICSDPPQHRLLRQQVHRAFATTMMDAAAHEVTALLGPALDAFVADGGGDFATTVAPQLPAGFLMAMFGVDRDEADVLLRSTRSMIGFRDAEYRPTGSEALALARSQSQILSFMYELIERRRRRPGQDLVSILLAATVNGRPMDETEVLYNCLNVAVGGNETTPFTATAAVEALIGWPDQAERLAGDPDLVPSAVEELLRWTTTNAYVQRTATRDVELHGVLIRAGDPVTLWNAAANRDERWTPDPDRLDLARTPNRHLAFGVGAHRCIGMGAARLELTLLLAQLQRRGLRFAHAGPVQRLRSNFMLGVKHLPVTVTAAR